MRIPGQWAPCRVCGCRTSSRDRLGPICHVCAERPRSDWSGGVLAFQEGRNRPDWTHDSTALPVTHW